MTAPFPTELALVKSGPLSGAVVKVLGEGNVWDYSVEDTDGERFRLDPEQLVPLTADTLMVLVTMTPRFIRMAIATIPKEGGL